MKSIKTLFIAILIAALATPAFAGSNAETGFGAIAGAIAGRALTRNSSQRTQNIATGLGMLAGGLAGNAYGDRQDRREAIERQYANNDTIRSLPSRTVNSMDAGGWVEQPAVTETRYVSQPVQTRTIRQTTQRDGCDEEYYHGEYNPEMAAAYCQGRRERIRQAYNEGLNGR